MSQSIEKTVDALERLDSLFRISVKDAFAIYQDTVVKLLDEHNKSVNIAQIASVPAFKTSLRLMYDDFVSQDADLLADLIIDVEKAEEDND